MTLYTGVEYEKISKLEREWQDSRHFINLTNGIEAFEHYDFHGGANFIRIQSTLLEQGQLEKVLQDLDYNFLMCLALGYRCVVYDYTSRYGGRRPSRACWQGLAWVEYALNRCWFKREIKLERGMHIHFKKIYDHEISKQTKKKLKYFRKFLFCEDLTIEVVCDKTKHDSQDEYYREILGKEKGWRM